MWDEFIFKDQVALTTTMVSVTINVRTRVTLIEAKVVFSMPKINMNAC